MRTGEKWVWADGVVKRRHLQSQWQKQLTPAGELVSSQPVDSVCAEQCDFLSNLASWSEGRAEAKSVLGRWGIC